jgi:hypothetical protein
MGFPGGMLYIKIHVAEDFPFSQLKIGKTSNKCSPIEISDVSCIHNEINLSLSGCFGIN